MRHLFPAGAHPFHEVLRRLGYETPTSEIETTFGRLTFRAFQSQENELCLAACSRVEAGLGEIPTVRLHSACLFGEAFRSLECDCRAQLDASLTEIDLKGGVLIYLFQEGRGIGLCAKLIAMELERLEKMSTVEAFKALGYEPDPRVYSFAVDVLKRMGVPRQIRLITNNPQKIDAVGAAGFAVVERVEPAMRLTRHALDAVRAKQRALGQIPFNNVEVIRKL